MKTEQEFAGKREVTPVNRDKVCKVTELWPIMACVKNEKQSCVAHPKILSVKGYLRRYGTDGDLKQEPVLRGLRFSLLKMENLRDL